MLSRRSMPKLPPAGLPAGIFLLPLVVCCGYRCLDLDSIQCTSKKGFSSIIRGTSLHCTDFGNSVLNVCASLSGFSTACSAARASSESVAARGRVEKSNLPDAMTCKFEYEPRLVLGRLKQHADGGVVPAIPRQIGRCRKIFVGPK